MFRITALHLADFGPFKGQQTVRLSDDDGVTVFYGENMRGKTSLLNAIRFAFFGKIIGRGMRLASLHRVGNWERAAEGAYGFEVGLEFLHDGHQFSLTRSCRPRPGVTVPQGDHDYAVEFYLARDGDVVGPQQAEAEMQRILPEQISRFFLFDGELLQEYEDLLSSESDMGRRISEAIERILGVPVLTNARATLLRIKDKSEQRVALAAQGDQKTREFGNQLADLHEQRRALNADLVRHEHELEELRTHKASLEDAMRKRERVAALLDKRDSLARDIGVLLERMTEKRSQLADAMGGAWCVLLAERIRRSVSELKCREAELQTAVIRTGLLRSLANNDRSECPACLQHISEDARRRLRIAVDSQGGATGEVEERELLALRRRLEALAQHEAVSNSSALRLLWDALEEVERDLYDKKSTQEELNRQLADVDEGELRSIRNDFESTIRQIDALERGVTKTRQRLDENKTLTDNIQRRLDKLAGSSLVDERRRRDLCAELHRLFDDAVVVYREQLRKRVEADATRHFRALTTEQDYEGLRINDSYGLTIVHRDGTDIPVRSAGAEHVVALSLMGALQNNAPLRGPIVIDSPFGRLDSGHTKNIVRALPSMAHQVALLVYEDELPPKLARDELKGKLRGEWFLDRRSARHTELVARKD